MSDNSELPPITNLCAEILYEPRTFQERVGFWASECFGGEVAGDMLERQDRFLEESLELLQAHGYDPSRIARVRDYVFNRPVGEPNQELGGVMLTLAALANAAGHDILQAGEAELVSAWTRVDKIRAKQAAKPKFQPEPIAMEVDEEGEAMDIAAQALRDSGFDEEEVEGFMSGDINAMSRDAVLKAISAALALR
jgi:hypothetical protein